MGRIKEGEEEEETFVGCYYLHNEAARPPLRLLLFKGADFEKFSVQVLLIELNKKPQLITYCFSASPVYSYLTPLFIPWTFGGLFNRAGILLRFFLNFPRGLERSCSSELLHRDIKKYDSIGRGRGKGRIEIYYYYYEYTIKTRFEWSRLFERCRKNWIQLIQVTALESYNIENKIKMKKMDKNQINDI